MAESAVTFLLDKLVPFLEEEVKLLRGVRGEVEFIRYELATMRVFLREADARQESDESIKAWVKQVRDVAYDVEDIIDEFMLLLAQRHQRHGFVGFLHKTTCFCSNFKERRRLATRIQDIKASVRNIWERNQYRFNIQEQGSSSTNSLGDTWHDLRGDARLLEKAELVGIHEHREELIRFLVEGDSRLIVASVVGMGGVAKYTLLKKVYDDQRVKICFQHHAWITVSQSFKMEELLKELIEQLFRESELPVPQGLETMKDANLKATLKDFLQQKRYVIVIDDVWSLHAWECLKYALPDSNCGSRIMVTTHNADIATSCIESSGHIYTLKPLQEPAAWSLFCKIAFRSDLGNICPPELKKLSQNILRRCEGLPIVIVAIGGLLSTKNKNLIEWQRVHDSLGAELESNDGFRSMKKVILLSYIDLPYYLKSCFLYLSIFPEGKMKINKLIRLWIAEGFVEEKDGNTVEEVAENYLKQLISRCLIQVTSTHIDGTLKTCKVHDILRDFIISKSKEENFSVLALPHHHHHQTNVGVPDENVRRLSIHSRGENVVENKSFSHLRSLFMFGIDKLPNWSIPVHTITCAFRLLRVLDLTDVPLEVFPSGIESLLLLKYLSLRGTRIKMVPSSIGKLENLETFDLKHTYVSQLPGEILKLKKLRHLLVYHYTPNQPFDDKQGFKAFMGIGGLVFLQKLRFIEANQGSEIIGEMGRLWQLRSLGIVKLRKEDGIHLCSSIEKMCNLRSLNVTSIDEDEILDLESLSFPPPLLQRLYLNGRLHKLPHWLSSLDNLAIVRLRWSKLRNELLELEVLQALPNLMELGLGDQAYDGEELCFKAGGFQRLQSLILDKLDRLRCVRVEEGALPSLLGLSISRCGLLEKVPLGIECLTNLKNLFFFDMPNEFCERLLPIEGVDHQNVAHIPIVSYHFWTDSGFVSHRLPRS